MPVSVVAAGSASYSGGWAFRMALLALLVVLGVWLIRGRSRANAAGSGQTVPAQGPQPTSPITTPYMRFYELAAMCEAGEHTYVLGVSL